MPVICSLKIGLGETVDLHSERNMNISVENDKAVNIDGHRTTKIGKTQNDEVVGDASFYYQCETDDDC